MKIPRWTDNQNFNDQVAHFGVGYGVAITAFAKTRHLWVRLGVAALFISYASLKEFWYDANYETPTQTFSDDLQDWVFYTLGFVAGAVIGGI